MKHIKDMPRILAKTDERTPINITPEAKQELWEFLNRDLEATGIGYSEFIRQSIRMWRELAEIDLDKAWADLESVMSFWRHGGDNYRDDDREMFSGLTQLRDALES